jgi:CheY-like chemotaxis protein
VLTINRPMPLPGHLASCRAGHLAGCEIRPLPDARSGVSGLSFPQEVTMVELHGRRILIADDRRSVRSSLRLLMEQRTSAVVVGEAADAPGLLSLLEDSRADILLLDWELPGLPVRYLVQVLRSEWPLLHIVAMSSRPEARELAELAGVFAFLSKGALAEDALAAIPPPAWPPDQPEDTSPGQPLDSPTA